MPQDIAHRPIKAEIQIRKDSQKNNLWIIEPQLMAFPNPQAIKPKNVIFVLDVSLSMKPPRLDYVKVAVNGLLEQLSDKDKFSIIQFNYAAQCLIENSEVNQETISKAKQQIEMMKADGSTDFSKAFAKIKERQLVTSTQNTSIIFLTDGNDETDNLKLVAELIQDGNKPKLIPIGISLQTEPKACERLCNLAALANDGKIEPIFINDEKETTYLRAFQKAFDLTVEHSEKPVVVKLVIEAKRSGQFTQLEAQRELTPIIFDGKNKQNYSFYFESPIPPTACKLTFCCDDIELEATHQFKSEELSKPNSISLDKLTWKDNSILSWVKSLSPFGLSALFFGGMMVMLLLSPFSFWLTLGVALIMGVAAVALLCVGVNNFLKKTVLKPTIQTQASKQDTVKRNNPPAVNPSVNNNNNPSGNKDSKLAKTEKPVPASGQGSFFGGSKSKGVENRGTQRGPASNRKG